MIDCRLLMMLALLLPLGELSAATLLLDPAWQLLAAIPEQTITDDAVVLTPGEHHLLVRYEETLPARGNGDNDETLRSEPQLLTGPDGGGMDARLRAGAGWPGVADLPAEPPAPVALARQSVNSIASPSSNSTVLPSVSKDLMKSSPTQIPGWRSSGETPPGATRATVPNAVTSYQVEWPSRCSTNDAAQTSPFIAIFAIRAAERFTLKPAMSPR